MIINYNCQNPLKRIVLSLIIGLLITPLLLAQSSGNYDVSGVYQASFKKGVVESLFSKKLIRITIFENQYEGTSNSDGNIKRKYRVSSVKNVIGKMETFRSKKAKKLESVEYFRANSFYKDGVIHLVSRKRFASDGRSRGYGSDIKIEKAAKDQFEFLLESRGSKYAGIYKKASNLEHANLMDVSNTLLTSVAKKHSVGGVFISLAGSNARRGKNIITTKDYLNVGETINSLLTIGSEKYIFGNPTMDWYNETKARLYWGLVNKNGSGFIEILKLLPNVKYIDVYLSNGENEPYVINKNNLLFFRVKVNKGEQVDFEIEDANGSLKYIAAALENDVSIAKQEEAERLHEEAVVRSRKRKANEEELRYKEAMASNGLPYIEREFWEAYPNRQYMFSNIYYGKFEYVQNDFFIKYMYFNLINYMSGACNEILPSSKRSHTFEVVNYENEYSHSLYNGGYSVTNVYNKTKNVSEVTIDVDPRYDKDYLNIRQRFNTELLTAAFAKYDRRFWFQNNLTEIGSLIPKFKCDKEKLAVFIENVHRLYNNKPSFQEESGIKY